MKKLRDAMETKGWEIAETARRCHVTDQSIRNLLGEGATRPTVPAKVTAVTMVRLMEVFFPMLDFEDFVPGTTLKIFKA